MSVEISNLLKVHTIFVHVCDGGGWRCARARGIMLSCRAPRAVAACGGHAVRVNRELFYQLPCFGGRPVRRESMRRANLTRELLGGTADWESSNKNGAAMEWKSWGFLCF